MEIQYDDTLPCLQAIAPWWNNTDRMMLYCRLLAIFPPLKAEYLSVLDAKSSAEPEYTLTAELIQSEFQTFRSKCVKGKCSCNAIRSLEFSFGKFNKRLCFLCPFHGTYKNEDAVSEHRFIYYLLNSEKLSLSQYLDGCSRELKDIFISHFPIITNGILIDAYPFYLFAEAMAEKGAGLYLKDPEAYTKSILEHVYASIEKRIRYNRSLEAMKNKIPNIIELLPDSADMEWESVLNMTPPFGVVNASIVKRVFNSLVKREGKYVARKPADYITQEKSLLVSQLQMGGTFGTAEGAWNIDEVKRGDGEPEKINEASVTAMSEICHDEEPKKACVVENVGEKAVQEGLKDSTFVFPENPLSGLDTENALFGESLDARLGIIQDNVMDSETSPERTTEEVKVTEPLSCPNMVVCDGDNSEDKDKEAKAPTKKELAAADTVIQNVKACEEHVEPTDPVEKIPLFYELSQDARIFVYGSDSPEVDRSLLDAFLLDSSYFCMEAVQYCGKRGLLIMNADMDYVYYNAELYGPSPLRRLADGCEPVYTSNLFGVSAYLQHCKVYQMQMKDVGFLEYHLHGGEYSLEAGFFYKSMETYKKRYEQLRCEAEETVKNRLQVEESFFPLLSASGNEPPFENLKSVAEVTKQYQVRYLYKQEKVLRSGAMLQIRVLLNETEEAAEMVKMRYEQVCVDLSRHYSIFGRNVYILGVTSEGILIYATGNRLDIQKLQFYLSSSCKRVFSGGGDGNPVTLYELREDCSPTAGQQQDTEAPKTDKKTGQGRKKKRN